VKQSVSDGARKDQWGVRAYHISVKSNNPGLGYSKAIIQILSAVCHDTF